MSIQIEAFEPRQEPEAILGLWQDCGLAGEFPLDRRLLEQQLRLERNALFGLRLVENGAPIGFALAKHMTAPRGDQAPDPGIGWISALGVVPRVRRRGLGSRLLAESISLLKARGAATIHWGRDSYHFFPGAPLPDPGQEAFLGKNGFVPGHDDWDLVLDLPGADLDALSRQLKADPALEIRPYTAADRPALEAFFARNFPGRWQQDIRDALDADPPVRPADLLVVDDRDRPRGNHLRGFARIYDAESTILGPGVYWRGLMGDQPGGLGPIGVDADCRGRGLGLRLLFEGLAALRRRGIGTMVIDWTDLVEFYGKMGFRPWKHYRHYALTLR